MFRSYGIPANIVQPIQTFYTHFKCTVCTSSCKEMASWRAIEP